MLLVPDVIKIVVDAVTAPRPQFAFYFSGSLCQSEYTQRHGFSRPPGAVDQPPDLLGRLARKRCFAAPLADLRGDVLHERASITLQRENLIHEPGLCRCIAAHMTFKHGRLVFGIRSTRSGRVDRDWRRAARRVVQTQHFTPRPRPERDAVGAGCNLQGC